jgi:hypothetical protein
MPWEQLQVRLRPPRRQPGQQRPLIEVGPWDGLSEIADHTDRRVRIDDLEKPALAQVFSIVELRSKGCRPAAEPDRVCPANR